MILEILKYIGIILASVATIWSATHVENKEKNGRKVLTKSGMVSIILTVLGLVLSITSNVFQEVRDVKDRVARDTRDSDRMDAIEFATEPLISLKLEFQFDKIPASIHQHLFNTEKFVDAAYQNEQGGSPDFNGDPEVYRRSQEFYYFLRHIATPNLIDKAVNGTVPTDENVIAIMSIDQAPNTVISFGILDSATTFNRDKFEYLSKQHSSLSGGIDFIDNQRYMRVSTGLRPVNNLWTMDSLKKNAVDFSWILDPQTLFNVIDRVDPTVNPTANLPKTIRLMIITRPNRIPFSSTNLAQYSDQDFWQLNINNNQRSKINIDKLCENAILVVTPNNREDRAIKYQLEGVYNQTFYDEQDEQYDCNAVMMLYKLGQKTF